MQNSVKTCIKSIKEIYSRYDYFIFDMDGVLWEGNHKIEQGVNAVNFLMNENKKVLFYTNNSTRSRETYIERLKQFGINADLKQVYSSSYVVSSYAKNKLNARKAFVLGMQGILDELELQNIHHVQLEDDENYSVNYEQFTSMKTDPDIDAVIVGFDMSFNYRKLCYASLCIQKGAKFLASNPDSNINVGGYLMPAGGSIVAAVAKANQIEPICTGKPYQYGYELISAEHNIKDNSRVVMIGDNLETDIQFGINNGLDSIVVLTGVCTKEQAMNSKATYVALGLFDNE